MRRVIRIVTVVALMAVVSAPAHAQSAGQSASDHPTICGEMAKAIKALPPSTDLYDWPDLINFPGLKHPRYREEDPQQHIDVITVTNLYLNPKQSNSLGAPVDETARQKEQEGVEQQIQNGFWTVESTTLNIDGLGKAKLYRLGERVPSEGTLGGSEKGPPRLYWTYAIGESEQVPEARNWPLQPGALRSVELLLINGKPYFALLPIGALLEVRFPPGFSHPHIGSICDFHLWNGRKP